MPSNKAQLYVALYVRGGAAKMPGKEDTYHWALLVGPKSDKQAYFHGTTQMVLVRILIAKIEDIDKLAQLLRQIPIRQEQQGWNCVLWIKEALSELQTSTNIVGTNVLEWEAVRNAAMSYCQQKKDEHRFDGTVKVDDSRVPTFDLIQGKETIK
ncbi:hypothetical protein KCU79_g8223, partial [Aureobasidium melanogenum]